MKRLIFPLLLGLVGGGVLISFGVWQLQRLEWKETVLAEIDARIIDAPVSLPAAPTPEADRYLPVTVAGSFTGEQIDILVSRKQIGAGVRVIEAFTTQDGRRIMVDRGFVAEAQRNAPREGGTATVTGNLHWPEEIDSYTPEPDSRTGLWFARDVPRMAAELKTEPLLVVARANTGGGIEAMPVDSSGIPNDHLGYAIQWFGLATVWLGMTGYLLWRIRRRTM